MNSEKQSVTLLFWNRAQPDGQRVSIGVNRPLTDAELVQVALDVGKYVEIIQVVKTKENVAAAGDETSTCDSCRVKPSRRRYHWLRLRKLTMISVAVTTFLAGAAGSYNSAPLKRLPRIQLATSPEIRRAIPVKAQNRKAIPVQVEIRKAIPIRTRGRRASK